MIKEVEQLLRTCNIMYDIELTWENSRFNVVRYMYRRLEYFLDGANSSRDMLYLGHGSRSRVRHTTDSVQIFKRCIKFLMRRGSDLINHIFFCSGHDFRSSR